jgi:outer membrane protein TolC
MKQIDLAKRLTMGEGACSGGLGFLNPIAVLRTAEPVVDVGALAFFFENSGRERNCRMMFQYVRKAIAVALCVMLLLAAPASAQQAPSRNVEKTPDYSTTLFNPLRYYRPMSLPAPVLVNSPSLEKLVSEGKLKLSLDDAISLAIENNLDIGVQRYVPQLASVEVLRSKSGQGTPAGSFDPALTGTLGWERRTVPINNPFLAGTGTVLSSLINYNQQANFILSQGFHTGTSYQITWNNSRASTSNPATFLNPSTTSTLILAFRQPLLNGFGFLPNTRGIRVALNNKRVADLTFQNQLITTVSQVQQVYWDLVYAREDVKVKQRSVELAEKLYNDNKRQVEIGTLAPIEVVRAESEVARTRQDLIISQTNLLRQQTLLKSIITKRVMDPAIAELEVIPTDTITDAPPLELSPLPDAVREAWEKRPDIRQSRINLETSGLNVRATRNALLPEFTLNGSFSGVGLAGQSRVTTTTPTGTYTSTGIPIVDAAGNPITVGGVPVFTSTRDTTSTSTILQGGYSDSLDLLRKFKFPTYGVSFTLTVPILNRAAQAENARAQLEQRQAEVALKRLENTIVVEVRNAQIAVEQSRASLDAARKARQLAERTLDAEQKKYQLGASTIFFVIQAQRDLADAQSRELNALVATIKAKVELERALGRTLEVNNITLAEAQQGQRNREPNIPGTPTAELTVQRGPF